MEEDHNHNKLAEEKISREREEEELERSTMSLEPALSQLSELGKKQSGLWEPSNPGQQNIGPTLKGRRVLGPTLKIYSRTLTKGP